MRIAARRWAARVKQVLTTEPGDSDDPDAGVRARALADEAARLGAGMTKVAQVAGYLQSFELDAEAGDPLAALFDRAPAVDAAAIAQVVERELGAPPRALFARWSDAPIAAASLGQVHAAQDADGRSWAVKVQYPAVADALRDDLASGGLVRQLASAALGDALDEAAIERVRRAVLRELDYRAEAEALGQFAAAFAGADDIVIPEVDAARSSERVLTMSRLQGSPPRSAHDASAEHRAAAARTLLAFTWRAPVRHGLVHGDPNPGNYLLDDRMPGTVGVLDFGCTDELDEQTRDRERRLWQALLHHDQFESAERFRYALFELGMFPDGTAMFDQTYREWERLVTAPFAADAPFPFTRDYAAALVEQTRWLASTGKLRLPASIVLLWRQRLGALSVIGELEAPVHARAVLRSILGV